MATDVLIKKENVNTETDIQTGQAQPSISQIERLMIDPLLRRN
jgi:hypothetical protein